MFKRVIPLTFFALVMLFLAHSAGAQSAPKATLYPVDTSQFPILSAYLDVRDEQGRFVPGLQANDLRIIENDRSLPVDSLSQLNPGIQFVVAIARGDALGIRDGLGKTRYDYLASTLTDWAARLPVPLQDDLSLVIEDGSQVIHTRITEAWQVALQEYLPTSREKASLQVLSAALDTADDPTERDGMSRVVLLITSPLVEGAEVGLPNLIDRATQDGIRIFIWFVAAPEFFDSPSAILFQELAFQTGGEYFAFSREEILPDMETYLTPLRSVYRLAYTSQVVASGSQQAAAEINTLAIQTISAPRTFILDVQPPNPIFLSPPSEIIRSDAELTGPDGKPATPEPDQDLLMPSSQLIEVLIEFPDGNPRSIITSTLYVDNLMADQNTTAPFEQFRWDLRPYTETGNHVLRVEVTDRLGLVGKTVEFPVQVTVTRPPVNVLAVISSRAALLVGSVVVVAGGVLLLVLVMGGRIHPHLPGRKLPASKRSRSAIGLPAPNLDPLMRPIASNAQTNSRLPNWLRRSPLHHTPTAVAFLSPVSDSENVTYPVQISLSDEELTLGSSPVHASVVLDDASLENLHARLRRQSESYCLMDEGSVAGTWVNYLPVSRKGVLLAHGDVVHIGRVKLRFTLRKPVHVRKPVIWNEETR